MSQTTILSSFFGERQNADSIASIRYNCSKTGPTNSFRKAEMRTFVMAIPPNIVDYSAYNSLKNNVIRFTWNSVDYETELSQASYDASGLTIALQTLMNDASSSTNFTVSYDINLAKFRITSAVGNFSLDFTADDTPWLELGFAQAVYSGAAFYISPYQVNLSWSSFILISIRELTTSCLSLCNGAPVTFAVAVTSLGTYAQGWEYLKSGPVHKQTFSCEQMLSQMTIDMYFIRADSVYPLVGDKNFQYTIDLKFK